jgi:outer membrane protein OmpA-like peptidoglycan-associated protein
MLDALTAKLAQGKPGDAGECFSAALPKAKREFFDQLFQEGGYRPAGAQPWKEIGRISGRERWELTLERPAASSASPAPSPAASTVAATPAASAGNPPTPTPAPPSPAPSLQPTPLPVPDPTPGALSGEGQVVLESPPLPPAELVSPAPPAAGSASPGAPEPPTAALPSSVSSSPPAPPPSPASQPLKLEADITLTREEGCRIADLRFPPSLLAAATPVLLNKGVNVSSAAAAPDPPDPLGASRQFLATLLARDFFSARTATDQEKVPREKLAGLCIVLEEGEFVIPEQSALNVTGVNDDRALTIIRVESQKEGIKGEFAIEMVRDATGAWKVHAVDLNDLLKKHVDATSADSKVPYRPIVPSPAGGESLAVFFEYNRSDLTPRAARQLEIVAGLLKSDPARKLQISGFADALGPEDYNFQLSKRRAETVRTKLGQLGVNPAQIVTQGFGEARPLQPNQKQDGTDDPEGRSFNRRTDIFLDF